MKINSREYLSEHGEDTMRRFCEINNLPVPEVRYLTKEDRHYHLGTCAFYRPHTISIAVDKCARNGYGGRAWSWPGYVIDRTPYGVFQHELGHHVDNHFFDASLMVNPASCYGLFSYRIYMESGAEKPLTGYLGTDKERQTFYMEWFAEIFRLFVTNPQLLEEVRPGAHKALRARLQPVHLVPWGTVLWSHYAPERIVKMAEKKIAEVAKKKNGHGRI